jgi:hypothetical protein
MNRMLLCSVILAALFVADAAFNHGAMRRDLTSALAHAGRSTQSAVVATTDLMVGKR